MEKDNLSNETYRMSHNIFHPEWTRRVSVGFTPWRSDKPGVYVVTYLPLTEKDTEEENFYDLAYIPKKAEGAPSPAPNTLKDYSSWIGSLCNFYFDLILYDAQDDRYYPLYNTTVGYNIDSLKSSVNINPMETFDLYRRNSHAIKRLIDLENEALRLYNGHNNRSVAAPDTRIGWRCECCGYRMYFNVATPVEGNIYRFFKGPSIDRFEEKPQERFTRRHDPKIEKFCPKCGTLNPIWDLYPRIWAKYGDKANNPSQVHYSDIEKEYPKQFKSC